ncbi:3-deoxy-manno-octulosonate cytidylyltransferase [Caballeronia turbans]|jgi:3-deoxy-manno-octulosonate cytidylyltransferase (CMP-KDO synthetase)|nr:3-deoxy-manno-octulosonate cytidylyltransferase [Caballeronia turbans]
MIQPKVVIVIPARFGSTRLPGKPLADIAGKPMIQHVVERASMVRGVQAVVVATDDTRVQQVVEAFGGKAMLTSAAHESGTDRLCEVMSRLPADIYINVQGDEPLLQPAHIEALVAETTANPDVQVGTLCHAIDAEEARDPNSVKVVCADNGDALYFSRSLIPYPRDGEQAQYLKHVGIYAYRAAALARYGMLPMPMIERAEKLEQLRLLHAGLRIRAIRIDSVGPSVDTQADLDRVRRLMTGEPDIESPPLAAIRMVITDVDGVLTDGGLYYGPDGEAIKRFHVRDGLGIRMLQEKGIAVAVVSGRDSAALRSRLADLRIELFRLGVKDKACACQDLFRDFDLKPAEVAFIGDDSIDLPGFQACGVSFAVQDAPAYIRQAADIVLNSAGGQGAFREVADAILLAKQQLHIAASAQGYREAMHSMAQ